MWWKPHWALEHQRRDRIEWRLRKIERLDKDRNSIVGENELGVNEPLLLYREFHPFEGNLLQAVKYFASPWQHDDWLDDELEKLEAKLERRAKYDRLVDELLRKARDGPIFIRAKRCVKRMKRKRRHMPTGEAAHHAALAPYKLAKGLMCAFDYETEQPYFYYTNDVSRQIARCQGALDTSVSNPEWFRVEPASHESGGDEPLPPPRRGDYDLGDEGRQAYHDARAEWFLKRTGSVLDGTLAEQDDRFQNACRSFRARASVRAE